MLTQEQIDTLDEIQSKHNNGRGISCVKSIIAYARHGDFHSALATRQSEGDKTRSYPDVENYLNELFGFRLHGNKQCADYLCK